MSKRREHLGDFKRWINSSKRPTWFMADANTSDEVLNTYFGGSASPMSGSFLALAEKLDRAYMRAAKGKISVNRIRKIVAAI